MESLTHSYDIFVYLNDDNNINLKIKTNNIQKKFEKKLPPPFQKFETIILKKINNPINISS